VSLPFDIAGWAADLTATAGTAIGDVDVLTGGCDGSLLGEAYYGHARSDVAEERGEQFGRSGWQLTVQALSAGEHELGVLVRSATGNATVCEEVSVLVSPTPLLSIDEPVPADTLLLPFPVAGWAADLASPSGPGVERIEVLDGGCQGRLLGEAEYGLERGDVSLEYGHQFGRSGWRFVASSLASGEHELGVRLVAANPDASTCATVPVLVQ
jgi:hypothetical protein